MSRRRILLAVLLVAVAATGGLLWALPEIVRRVAVDQIPKALHRAVSIEDVDLNVFTGRFSIKKVRLADRQGPDAFVELDRLDGRLAYLPLFGGSIRLTDLSLTRPRVRLVRTGPREFNFTDLIPAPDPHRPPSRWVFVLDRLALSDGAVLLDDRAMSPPRQWRIGGLTVGATSFTSSATESGGKLTVAGTVNDAKLDLTAQSLGLGPGTPTIRVALERFDLLSLLPYLPPDVPARPQSGKVSLVLTLAVERKGESITKARLNGDVRVDDVALVQADRPAPFFSAGRVAVGIKEADLLTRAAILSTVEVDGLDVQVGRTASGDIDVLAALRQRRTDGSATVIAPGGPSPSGPGPPAPGAPAPAETAAPPPPSPAFQARIERLAVRSGRVTVTDEAVTPTRVWRIDSLTVDGADLATTGEDASGTLAVRARLDVDPSSGKPATISVDAASVRLSPVAASARVSLEGFDVSLTRLYLPSGLPAVLYEGTLAATLDMAVELGEAGLRRATASGRGRLDGVTLAFPEPTTTFLKVPKIALAFKQIDYLARTMTLDSVEIDTPNIRAVRDPQGRIDLLALGQFPPAPPPASPAAPGRAPAGPGAESAPSGVSVKPAPAPAPPWKLRLDRFALNRGMVTFEDRAVSPVTTLVLSDLTVTADGATWPAAQPAKLAVTAGLPGGGLFMMQGTVLLSPLDIKVAMSTLDAPLRPFAAYFPFQARLSGLVSGDSVTQVRIENGQITAASQGNGWVKNLVVRDEDAQNPAAKMELMEIRGIDFSWPNYAFVDRVAFIRPEVRVEREADGTINLRRMLTPKTGPEPLGGPAATSTPTATTPPPASPATPPATATPPAPTQEKTAEPQAAVEKPAATEGASTKADDKPIRVPDTPATAEDGKPGLMETMVLDFKEIAIEEGYARFVDETLKPTFSEDMSRLAVSIRGLSNATGRRATLTATAIVGGDAALDLRGEMSRLGDDVFADLVGELRDFNLASVSPYTNSFLSWIVQGGKLGVKIHYRVERDQVTGSNEIMISNMAVAPAAAQDEVKRRVGLPLSMIVSLLKDSRGNIGLDLPLSGNWRDRSFNWGEAAWAAVKQVIVKVLAAPFRAIGRLFTGGGKEDKVEELSVDPVVFSAGSSVLGPAAEGHLKRVADFLRKSPFVKLSLSAVVTARDADSAKGQELTVRIQRLQRERGMVDFAAAVRAYFIEQAPTVTPPKTADEQLALLRQREPLPEARLQQLLTRRLSATLETLTRIEGIEAERLQSGPAKSMLEAGGEGRVEFTIAG